MQQLIITKSGGPHPYVDPAPEKVGVNWTPWLRGPWLNYQCFESSEFLCALYTGTVMVSDKNQSNSQGKMHSFLVMGF